MSRHYRKCGGCHPTESYCDCGNIRNINFDTTEAVTANELQPTYFGTLKFFYNVLTSGGAELPSPQFQSLAWDGEYMYLGICDKYDRDACIYKLTPGGEIVRRGPVIPNGGHIKLGYDFKTSKLYAAQRKLESDWEAKGVFRIDPDTLAPEDYGELEKPITAFVQCEKDLYYVGSDSSHLYKVNNIDLAAGVIWREEVCTLPLPKDFYDELAGASQGVQCWLYDGRTVVAIRNNPQFAMIYDTITKRYTLTHIGDIADYRNIGEIEGGFTWEGRSVMISANDIADPLEDAGGGHRADIYVQFWYHDISMGGAGSLNLRENTHPTFSAPNRFSDAYTHDTTTKNVIFDAYATNFYCNGSAEFPFHSIHEAINYAKNVYWVKGIRFNSDFYDTIRLQGVSMLFTNASGGEVNIRFAQAEHCDLTLSGITINDSQFEYSRVFLAENCSETISNYDDYSVPVDQAHPDGKESKGGKNNVWEFTEVIIAPALATLYDDIKANDLIRESGGTVISFA